VKEHRTVNLTTRRDSKKELRSINLCLLSRNASVLSTLRKVRQPKDSMSPSELQNLLWFYVIPLCKGRKQRLLCLLASAQGLVPPIILLILSDMPRDSRKSRPLIIISNRFKDSNSYNSTSNQIINRFYKPCPAKTRWMTRSRCSNKNPQPTRLLHLRKIRKNHILWLLVDTHHSRNCKSQVQRNRRTT
jgi:hypothetical protein